MPQVNTKKVMIMAGGTGGHVFPALAVAQELIDRGCLVEWLGTEKGIEAKVVPKNNIKLNHLKITGVRGKGAMALLVAPWKILLAIVEAKKIIQTFRPHVVVGMGGYVSGPGGIAAWLLGIPLLVHEQNARAGTTNKYLAKFAKKVLVAFPDALPNGQWIGNPIRKSIIQAQAPSERFSGRSGSFRLLVLGGSLGAKAINELLPKVQKAMPSEVTLDVIHQTGSAHYESTQALYNELQLRADVKPFIDDMATVLSWADLVVCRSGALTVSELSAVGVASILVPYPYAIDDHQTANANILAAHGAAYIYQQSDLTVEVLKSMILEFIQKPEKALEMAISARSLAKPEATSVCADLCLELANG